MSQHVKVKHQSFTTLSPKMDAAPTFPTMRNCSHSRFQAQESCVSFKWKQPCNRKHGECTKYLCKTKRNDVWLSCPESGLRRESTWQRCLRLLLNKQKRRSPPEIPWAGSAWKLGESLGMVDKLALFLLFPGYRLVPFMETKILG